MGNIAEKFKEQRKKLGLKKSKPSKPDVNNQNGITQPDSETNPTMNYPDSESGIAIKKVNFGDNQEHEISENGQEVELNDMSSRGDDFLTEPGHDFDARKFSAASVDVLIDGLDLKREK